MIPKGHLIAFYINFFILAIIPTFVQNYPISCDANSPYSSGFLCNKNGSQNQCQTFAVFRTNSYYSSVFNLSSYLGINRFNLVQANGFSSDVEVIPENQPILIPIECKCSGVIFEAVLTKTTVKGDSFSAISESLEGLTTCKAIENKNPSVKSWDLSKKVRLSIPLSCACPSSEELIQKTKFLLSYPVSQGDTIANLALKFNVTPNAIVLANSRSARHFNGENLFPFSVILIPLKGKPILNLGIPARTIPATKQHKRKRKMWVLGVYIGVSVVVFGVGVAILGVFLVNQWKKKREVPGKTTDLELQQLSLSIRTTSEKKVSFDRGSQDTLDGQIIDSTPRHHKILIETHTIEELKKATEDFNSSNLIEESVFHGRLNGKEMAIKRSTNDILSKIDFGLFHNQTHFHPNIIRLMGTCSTLGNDSYLVFEYAKNGSLKDWLHGGLAMKSQFISSCYCFLNWNQRLKICLDVATALQYMHQVMIPSYVHRNIKSRNVFLDEEFNAKIGNFGMGNCVDDDSGDKHSSSIYWNKGYLAPEFLQNGTISPSIDIFAFGVVLLEVLSGKTPIARGDENGDGSVWLSEEIKSVLESENAEELRGWMDSSLGESYSFDGAVTLANLARACVGNDPSLRPSAGEIVEKLSRLVEELPELSEQFSVCDSSSKPLVKATRT